MEASEPTPSSVMQFEIEGTTYSLDLLDLTVEEALLIEEQSGVEVEVMSGVDWRSKRVLREAAWIAMRRVNPAATIEDAGKLRIVQRRKQEGAMQDPPTPPEATGPAASPA